MLKLGLVKHRELQPLGMKEKRRTLQECRRKSMSSGRVKSQRSPRQAQSEWGETRSISINNPELNWN
uniref:Uncharacterized protein n=1 Tax=Pyxicephalus adspersus TaxID=30357 RepID=A0AAV3B2D9_PYXAD|nr:TPA: hypothetical protein GDO54_002003 [Pyxicephalus adspersus]